MYKTCSTELYHKPAVQNCTYPNCSKELYVSNLQLKIVHNKPAIQNSTYQTCSTDYRIVRIKPAVQTTELYVLTCSIDYRIVRTNLQYRLQNCRY